MSEEQEVKIDIGLILDQIKESIPSEYGSTIGCAQGWHALIAKCHLELQVIDPLYRPYQIKEKFGGLRYYFGTKTDGLKEAMMWETALKYEKLSRETCELTGKPGKLMVKDGIYKTLAPEYEKEGWEPVNVIDSDLKSGI